MTLKDLPPTISVEQAAELLGISRRSAYRAASHGEIPTLRLGRRVLVPTPRLLDLLGAGDLGSVMGGPDEAEHHARPRARRLSPPVPVSTSQ
jgi:excisionase family DNA binding protein